MLLSKCSIIYTSSAYKLFNSIMLSVWQRATAVCARGCSAAADVLQTQSEAELQQPARQQLMNEQLPYYLSQTYG